MPNLFSVLPVLMYLWVFAETSGFTRIAIGARLLNDLAISSMALNSCSDSILKLSTSQRKAYSISSRLLPTPAKVHFAGLPPALITR